MARRHGDDFPNGAELWDRRFVLTLPFDVNLDQRYRSERLLERTRRRWAWFERAAGINPQLGTLVYLPFEIRAIILQWALTCRPTTSIDGVWEYDHGGGKVFDLRSYYFGYGSKSGIDGSVMNLDRISPTVRLEYQDVFLSKTPFRFNHPESVERFLARLNQGQRSRLTHVALGVLVERGTERWLEVVSKLPIELKCLQLLVLAFQRGRGTFWNFLPGYEGLRRLVEVASTALPTTHISISAPGSQELAPEAQAIAIELAESMSRERRSRRDLSM